jgi:hypothetical protein
MFMKLLLLLLPLCAVVWVGCTGVDGAPGQPGLTGPIGPPGPALAAKIIGYVQAVDGPDYPSPNSSRNDSVIVVLEGTTLRAVSDVNGRWEIDSAKTGTYVISFSKPGYGTVKLNSVQVVGGGTLFLDPGVVDIVVTRIAPYVLMTVELHADTANVTLSGTVSDTTGHLDNVIAFFGKSDSSSASSLTADLQQEFLTVAGTDSFFTQIPKSAFAAAGFSTGSTVFVTVYGFNPCMQYTDIASGRQVVPTLSVPPQKTSLVLP